MPIHDKIDPTAKKLVQQLVDQGYETYIVGGAVRDLLLGLSPKDYDIATEATPEQVRSVFGRRRARIIGRRFRLVHVRLDGEVFEVSTFRREPSSDERQARDSDDGVMLWRDNEFGSLHEDAHRRDFTVNSLYYDPCCGNGLVDHVGGSTDLDQRTVKAIGVPRRRFEEDPVRILRALKLVGQLDFVLHPDTEAAVREMVDLICLASRARLFEELLKIMNKPYCLPVLQAFRDYGLLAHFWPHLDTLWTRPEGEMCRSMLAERDRRMKEQSSYTLSKTLSIATLALLPAIADLGGTPTGLWEVRAGLERPCRDAVCDFLFPFPLPRFLSARTRDIILLLPRFLQDTGSKRLLRHPEYKYARELFLLWGHSAGVDRSTLESWPAPKPETPRHHRPESARGERPPRRRRRKRPARE